MGVFFFVILRNSIDWYELGSVLVLGKQDKGKRLRVIVEAKV